VGAEKVSSPDDTRCRFFDIMQLDVGLQYEMLIFKAC